MKTENPLMFYPRRTVEATTTALRWFRLARRYRGIMRRVLADPEAARYTDEALRPSGADTEMLPNFVQVFANKIPRTHGAPVREPVH